MSLITYFKRKLLPDPIAGEIWGHSHAPTNPWREVFISKVKVISVKNGWVAYTSNRHATRTVPIQHEDDFATIADFKDSYETGPLPPEPPLTTRVLEEEMSKF